MPVIYPSRGRGARVRSSWVRGSSGPETTSHKWTRARQDNHKNPGMVEGTSNNDMQHSITREVDATSMSMVKRGSYQLVSKTKVDKEVPVDPRPGLVASTPTRGRKRKLGGQPSPHHSMTLMGNNKWKAPKGAVNHQNVTDDMLPVQLVRRGTYQLVLKNKNKKKRDCSEEGESVPILSVTHDNHKEDGEEESAKEGGKQSPGEDSARRPTSLKKIGSHKMVLESRTEHKEVAPRQIVRKYHNVDYQTKIPNQSLPPRHSNSRDSHGRSASMAKLSGPKRGHTPFDFSTNSRTMPKRIRLTATDTTVQGMLESKEQDNSRAHAAETKDPQERLSKFAYCETGRKGPRRHMNRALNFGNNQVGQGAREEPRKMGLVRANRNENAPICPFYAKGMECTDRFCQKRHDVPIESAVPVCSFFQRNGQCLKEDCRFRHIKINAQAAICPTFALLGYCENVDCTMKHVVGASQPIHSSKTIQRRNVHTYDDLARKR